MNFNEGLAVAGALELTDSELETTHGGWGGREDDFGGFQSVWIPGEGWVLIPVEPDYYGGWGDWGGRGWGGRGWGGWGGRGRGGHGWDKGGTWKKPKA